MLVPGRMQHCARPPTHGPNAAPAGVPVKSSTHGQTLAPAFGSTGLPPSSHLGTRECWRPATAGPQRLARRVGAARRGRVLPARNSEPGPTQTCAKGALPAPEAAPTFVLTAASTWTDICEPHGIVYSMMAWLHSNPHADVTLLCTTSTASSLLSSPRSFSSYTQCRHACHSLYCHALIAGSARQMDGTYAQCAHRADDAATVLTLHHSLKRCRRMYAKQEPRVADAPAARS